MPGCQRTWSSRRSGFSTRRCHPMLSPASEAPSTTRWSAAQLTCTQPQPQPQPQSLPLQSTLLCCGLTGCESQHSSTVQYCAVSHSIVLLQSITLNCNKQHSTAYIVLSVRES